MKMDRLVDLCRSGCYRRIKDGNLNKEVFAIRKWTDITKMSTIKP